MSVVTFAAGFAAAAHPFSGRRRNPDATTASFVGLAGPYASCDCSSAAYGSLSIGLVAGGSWAFPSFVRIASGDSLFGGQTYSTITVTGASSATEACTSDVCDAFLAVGSTAVEVSYTDPGAAQRAAVLAAFAKALAAT